MSASYRPGVHEACLAQPLRVVGRGERAVHAAARAALRARALPTTDTLVLGSSTGFCFKHTYLSSQYSATAGCKSLLKSARKLGIRRLTTAYISRIR